MGKASQWTLNFICRDRANLYTESPPKVTLLLYYIDMKMWFHKMWFLQNVVPQNVVPQNVVPQNVVPKNMVPQNVVSKNVVPQNVVALTYALII